MTVIVSIFDIIKLVVLFTVLIASAIFIIVCMIQGWYNTKFKNNCFKCKHYYLRDVASAGDCCWYSCKCNKDINDQHSMNDNYMYRKCNNYKEVKRSDKYE